MKRAAVLFLVFKRPAATASVFEAIRKARPPRLYVAADGPRSGVAGEAGICDAVRRIATQVDWPCEVHTRFRDRNLGCHYAIEDALDWFFSQEAEGIVLEDDCQPHADLFPFCEAMLDRFRDDTSVWHIGGNNFGIAKAAFGGHAFAYVPFAQVWGWASWADRWRKNPCNAFALAEQSRPERWALNRMQALIKRDDLDRVCEGLATWDYQWQVTVLNHGGRAVVPAANLVTNIGAGSDATHTGVDSRIGLPTAQWEPGSEPPAAFNTTVTKVFARQMGLASPRRILSILLARLMQVLDGWARQVAVSLALHRSPPLVVASSGRQASTLVWEAVVRASVRQHVRPGFRWTEKILQLAIRKRAWRLDQARLLPRHVYKTHDLPGRDLAQGGDARYLFLFGDPLQSALSTQAQGQRHGLLWIDEHIHHLRGRGRANAVLEEDVLNFEEQIGQWTRQRPERVLVVHYEDLWERLDEISGFLGVPVELEPRTHRSSGVVPDELASRPLFKRLREVEAQQRRAPET